MRIHVALQQILLLELYMVISINNIIKFICDERKAVMKNRSWF